MTSGRAMGLCCASARRAAVVIDTGPDAAAMRRCLDQLRVAVVPLLILTHFHADHVDGLSGVLSTSEGRGDLDRSAALARLRGVRRAAAGRPRRSAGSDARGRQRRYRRRRFVVGSWAGREATARRQRGATARRQRISGRERLELGRRDEGWRCPAVAHRRC